MRNLYLVTELTAGDVIDDDVFPDIKGKIVSSARKDFELPVVFTDGSVWKDAPDHNDSLIWVRH